jgi:hypothetical protein
MADGMPRHVSVDEAVGRNILEDAARLDGSILVPEESVAAVVGTVRPSHG